MTDNQTQPNGDDGPDQETPAPAKPEPAGRPTQPTQTTAAAQPSQRAAPGRRPLFRS
jgi:hypothetical protein